MLSAAQATVLTWNVAGRVRDVAQQAAALDERACDLVALQEIRVSALATWRSELQTHGYEHVLDSLDVATAPPLPDRRLGVLIGARRPLAHHPAPPLPMSERHVAATTSLAGCEVLVHVLHSPVSARPGGVKVLTLEAMAAELSRAREQPVLLLGDLNTPQYESREGEIRSFARTRTGRIRPQFGERHDRAELGMVPGLAQAGYVDAFRAANGYEARDRSWMYPNRKFGYRLDHVFIRGLRVERCEYIHAWRDWGLSDHSALWATVASRC